MWKQLEENLVKIKKILSKIEWYYDVYTLTRFLSIDVDWHISLD